MREMRDWMIVFVLLNMVGHSGYSFVEAWDRMVNRMNAKTEFPASVPRRKRSN
jgi:hypothetical protein